MLRRTAVYVAGTCPSASPNDLVKFVLEHELETADGVARRSSTCLAARPRAPIRRSSTSWSPSGWWKVTRSADLQRAFSRLEWLERNEVQNESLTTALADLRSRLPEKGLEGSPYPGLDSWIDSGARRRDFPADGRGVRQAHRGEPRRRGRVRHELRGEVLPATGESSREDAVAMLGETVRTRPAAGLELWPHLSEHPDLQGTVIAAWGHTAEQDDAEAIIDVLVAADLRPVLHSVGQFLIHADQSDAARWDSCQRPTCSSNASGRPPRPMRYSSPGHDPRPELDEQDHQRARRAADGVLVRDVPGVVGPQRSRLTRGAASADEPRVPSGCSGGPDRGRLVGPDPDGVPIALPRCGRTSSWCREHLLPLRDWSDPLTAEPFWWGVLSNARWNSGLVADGLLDGLLETVDHLDVFADDQRQRWASMLASIAVRCEAPVAETWVDKMTSKTPDAQRVAWLEGIGEELKAFDDDDGRAAVWAGWLAAYCKRRIEGDPVTLAGDEAHALALLAPHVSSGGFVDAVNLILATKAGLRPHGDVSRQVSEELIDAQPVEVGRFFTHLMKNTDQPFWGEFDLIPEAETTGGQATGGHCARLRYASASRSTRPSHAEPGDPESSRVM